MTQAKYSDKSLIIDILSESFDTNKSVNYVVKQDKKRKQRIRGLIAYSFEVCFAFGEVWLSEDKKGCALILYPDRKKTTLTTILWDIKLVLSLGISRISKVLSRESKIKNFHPQSSFTHLWFIGVLPAFQKQKTGSGLLKEILTKSKNNKLPVYLETSVPENITWYASMEFETIQTLEIGEGTDAYTLFMMKKEL